MSAGVLQLMVAILEEHRRAPAGPGLRRTSVIDDDLVRIRNSSRLPFAELEVDISAQIRSLKPSQRCVENMTMYWPSA